MSMCRAFSRLAAIMATLAAGIAGEKTLCHRQSLAWFPVEAKTRTAA